MSQQTIKQAARRAALDATSKRRIERAEREKRIEAIAVRVLVAVGERDAAVAEAECRAGQAVWDMTELEGLSMREVVQWCGEEITAREASRLRRCADQPDQVDAAGEPVSTGEEAEAGAAGSGRTAPETLRVSSVE